eukprot:357744-Chlamydomonas_euryale.AAC.6
MALSAAAARAARSGSSASSTPSCTSRWSMASRRASSSADNPLSPMLGRADAMALPSAFATPHAACARRQARDPCAIHGPRRAREDCVRGCGR